MNEGEWVGFLKAVFGFLLKPVGEGTNLALITRSQLRFVDLLWALPLAEQLLHLLIVGAVRLIECSKMVGFL